MISSVSSSSYVYNTQQSFNITKAQYHEQISTHNDITAKITIDKDGFYSQELNDLAGVSSNIKIHKTTLDQLTTYAKNTKSNLNPIQALSKAWNFFKDLVGDNIDPDKPNMLDFNDISKMPASYCSDGTIFGALTYKSYTLEQTLELNKLDGISSLSKGKLDIGRTNLLHSGMKTEVELKYFIEGTSQEFKEMTGVKYNKNTPKGKMDLGVLFASFIHHEVESNPNGKVKEVKNYYEFLKSGKSLEEYLNETFGDNYSSKIKKDFIKRSTTPSDVSGKAFDMLLSTIEKSSQKFFSLNESFIKNHKEDDFTKISNNFNFKVGDFLSLKA